VSTLEWFSGVVPDLPTVYFCIHNINHIDRHEAGPTLTIRRLFYIYMEHPFLMFLDHTQRRSTVGRTPLDE